MQALAEGRTGDQGLVQDYEQLFEPLTGRFCEALLEFSGGISPEERVIDVAAGTGALSLPVARAGASLLACDISPAAVERLAEKLRPFPKAEARVLDGQALEVEDSSFGAAFSAFGVMLFPDFRAGLKELVRVTRPGGRMGLAVWAQPQGSPPAAPFRAAFAAAFPDRPPPPFVAGTATLSDPLKLRRSLEGTGCDAIAIRACEFPWAVPSHAWVGENMERIFRDHPIWTALSHSDQERLRAALLEQVDAMDEGCITGRAWLATAKVRAPRRSGLATTSALR